MATYRRFTVILASLLGLAVIVSGALYLGNRQQGQATGTTYGCNLSSQRRFNGLVTRFATWELTGQAYHYLASGSKPPDVPLALRRHIELTINGQKRQLTISLDGRPVQTYPVAVGKSSTPTPIGHWHIVQRDIWGGAFGARWMKLSVPWGNYGLHGTNRPGSVGSFASHGCIRMRNRHVVKVYPLTILGTPITVKGEPHVKFGEVKRTIVPTLIGSDVMQMQQKLRDKGLYDGPVDGKMGPGTVAALKRFQEQNGLKPTGIVREKSYKLLGIVPYGDDPTLKP